MAPTKRTPEEDRAQALAHLKLANPVRVAQGKMHRKVERLPRLRGEQMIADLIRRTGDPALQGVRVEFLLRWPRQRGPSHARRVTDPLRIDTGRRIRDLTKRQRGLVADAIEAGYLVTPEILHTWVWGDRRMADDPIT